MTISIRAALLLALCALTGAEVANDFVEAARAAVEPASKREHPDLTVLGFVTPWNKGGSEVAKIAAQQGRLDVVSPVSLSLRSGKVHGEPLYVEAPGASLHPRVHFEDDEWTKDVDTACDNIAAAASNMGADGVVLEVWHASAGRISNLKKLGDAIRKRDLTATLVVPPLTRQNAGQMDTRSLGESFDHFIVMAYDFSTPGGEPGPVSPVAWVRSTANYWATDAGLGKKVLLGLNFYGVNFGSRKGTEKGKRVQEAEDRHIVGHEVLDILRAHNPRVVMYREMDVAEHVFEYTDGEHGERLVFYPTKASVSARVVVAEQEGCGGVAVWELGQGLRHFLNAL